MNLPLRRDAAWIAVVAGALVAASGVGWAQANKERKGDPHGPGGGAPAGRASGVLVKVEDIAPDKDRSRTPRLTINTAAPWRDFARDQAPETKAGNLKADAVKGAKSVAAEGHPDSEDALVTVDLGPDTRIEVRFRASDDETTAGASTPPAAVAQEKGSKAPRVHARPAKANASDLRKGLYVEADFLPEKSRNLATRVVIIKPIGGPNTPDSEPGREVKGARPKGE